MVQRSTTRYHDQTAPGFCFTPAQERATESCVIPYNCQKLTITLAGTDPSVAGDYVISFPLPSDGSTYSLTYTTAGAALLLDGPAIAVAWNADPVASQLYFASAAGAVITLTALSSNTSIAAASWSGTKNGGTTATIAQTVASAATSIRMGVLYKWAPASSIVQGISGTPRAEWVVAPLATGDTVDVIRGMVMREMNATQMDPGFSNSTADQYLSGHVFPGLLRGVGTVVVDPASATITPATVSLYAVLAAGANTIVGAVTTVADGGNTVLINSGANPFARVYGPESTPVFQTPSTRLARIAFFRAS
jgi:hypothetical protein